MSVIGALLVDIGCRQVEFLFQVLKGENVDSIRFRSFLAALLQTVRGKLILVLDNLAVHHAAIIERFVFENRHRLSVVYLPPYAPELNPVEYVWDEMKYHQMANYAPADLEALEKKTVEVGMAVSLEKRILKSCLAHSPLMFWRT